MAVPSLQSRFRQALRRWRERAQPRLETSLEFEPLVIVMLLAAVIVGFVITGAAARAFHGRHEALGRQWFVSGEKTLREGRPRQAVEDFRNALMFAREDRRYRLRLAQALVASGAVEEARTYLLNLWEREPGDATVNLELARIFAARGDVQPAANYYHNAIHGLWRFQPERRRLETRFELVEFLLSRGARRTALPELMALSGELPADNALAMRVAGLCMRAQDYACAYDLFGRVLREQERNAEALKGAGAAAFHRGQYLAAQRHLRRVPQRDQDEQMQRWLRLATLVLETDPYQRGVSASERNRRTIRAFRRSLERLQDCLAPGAQRKTGGAPLAELQQLQTRGQDAARTATEARLRRDPDQRDALIDMAFAMQRAAERECGPGAELDQALLLVARRQEGAEP